MFDSLNILLIYVKSKTDFSLMITKTINPIRRGFDHPNNSTDIYFGITIIYTIKQGLHIPSISKLTYLFVN